MITITKDRLLTIKQWREIYGPGSNVVLPAEEAEELARIALASLEAKPIGAFHIAEQRVDGTSDYLKDGEWPIDNGIIEVYAASPMTVVLNDVSGPLALAYKELTPAIMRNHIAVFERYGITPNDSITTIHALRIALDGIERSDAMLHAGNFRENANSSTNNFREITETSTNSLVTPDGWISCSERMPDDGQHVIILCDGAFVLYAQYRDGEFFDVVRDGDEFFETQSRNVTDWMPLPEPPQEVRQ
ncbi:DUF551 domain-containing protein [Escherichia coli]|uniref:DUF551 domain-containing protein n=5 Tax=Escherichia coli TaxID=562 RepID=UPI00084FAF9B|nr:DUF551 domain-containing protein [Escherichia coli]APT02511.1 hypothetical protein BJJ90_11060 [Escherichia coli]EFH5722554.1 DUF551 domain-containing protein [Escherichia coli]EGG0941512.1 DUF551 domain-containing protein [Escherichia coli]EIG8441714.1 DUF551 domain-containing protein [Escherichia coli]EIW6221844.1 DUF551 domain-containing protein [Escherichia coli]